MQFTLSRMRNCVAVLLLGACVAPGAPKSIQAPQAIEAAFPDCRFIDASGLAGGFVTNYYLTTYGSAYVEGGTAGGNSALQGASEFAAPLRSLARKPFEVSGESMLPTGASAPAICLIYDNRNLGEQQALSRARSALENFGYRSSGLSNGFRTNWKRGGHQSADWYDRYTVVVAPTPGSPQLVAMVRREVYIKRKGFSASFDESSAFYEATSVGANESWILRVMGGGA